MNIRCWLIQDNIQTEYEFDFKYDFYYWITFGVRRISSYPIKESNWYSIRNGRSFFKIKNYSIQ